MPDSCCAVGCSNKRSKGSSLKFYRIPFGITENSLDLRRRWVAAIRRDNWTEKEIDNARLCSEHFIAGQRSKDPSHSDYVPSVFAYNAVRSSEAKKKLSLSRHDRYSRRRLRELDSIVVDDNDYHCTEDVDEGDDTDFAPLSPTKFITWSTSMDNIEKIDQCTQTDINFTVLPSKFLLDVQATQSLLNFYTGLPDYALFTFILELISAKDVHVSSKISLEDHLLLVLMKLKLGLMHSDLAYRFSILLVDVSRIYKCWIIALAKSLAFLFVWPERDALRSNLPSCFKKFRNCACIIDCTEIFIERPLDLTARAQTWSNYKHHNTVKYLISITAAGAVSFLSQGWGGRVSDKELTIKSHFFDKLQHGDSVLADRGFTIKEELAAKGATLAIPHFTRGKDQMSAKEVEDSRKISNVQIHVERVIGHLRKFRILQTTIPIKQVKLLDPVMIVICPIVNLNDSVVS